MFKITSKPESNVVAVKIGAAVTKEDYDLALPHLEDKIKSHGKVRLYCEIDNVSTITSEAIKEDLKFDIKHLTDFEKVAIIGERGWEKWLTKIGSVFTSAEVRYYEPQQKAEAMKWVTHNN